jgi:hypothetical protein
MTHDMISKSSEFKTAEIKLQFGRHHRRPSVMPSLVVIHPFQPQPGGISPSQTTPAATFYKARLSILILSKT